MLKNIKKDSKYAKIMKKSTILLLFLALNTPIFALDMRTLADSINNWVGANPEWAGFELGCVPKVKVTQVKTKKDDVWVYTNKALSGISMSPQDIAALRRKVSRWVLGGPNGRITIYSDGLELNELVTDRFKSRSQSAKYPIPNKHLMGNSLQGQNIALWPSHGVYYNRDEDRWKLQRATMWSTVEDLYSTYYAEQVTQILERAGATVYWPRARYGKDEKSGEIGKSGYPRWAEGARYWLEYIGVPDSIWNPITDKNDPAKDSVRNDYLDDLRSRGNWVNWLSGGSSVNPNAAGQGIPISVCLALHTDGYSQVGDSITIGTLAIYSQQDNSHSAIFPTGQDRIINRDLADYVQTQIVGDIRALYDSTWSRRQLQNASYCESRYPVVPALLLEILSHKQMADIRYGLQPQFRKDIARAIYKGVGRWIHAQTETDFVVQPLKVQKMSISPVKNEFVVTWSATIDSLEESATPEYYLVEVRENDGLWQSPIKVKKPTYSFHPQRGTRYDIRVTACNDGGLSETSEIISAHLGASDKPVVLVVNAFNRTDGPEWQVDSLYAGIASGSYTIPDGEDGIFIGNQWEFNRALDWVSDDDCGWGMCYRDQTGTRQVGNTFDYAVQHGRILQKLGYTYFSTNITAIDSIPADINLVDCVLGRTTRIPSIIRHWQGKLLLSGSYIGTVPRASYSGLIRFNGTNYRFAVKPNDQRLCAADATGQVVKKNEQVLARYIDSSLPACVQSDNAIRWSFPLEAAEDFDKLYTLSIERLITK